jgi:mannosyltransferase OCH1-like enzyme
MEFPFPKIIHQTWDSNVKSLPDPYKESITKWKKFHPSWKHRFTTSDENRIFVMKHFPQYLETYDSFPHPIQRSYMIRYMYLYHFGGVYSDLSIIPTKSLLDYDFISSPSDIYLCNEDDLFLNSFLISKPKCTLWLDLLHHSKMYKKSFFSIPSSEITDSIGSNALTRILLRHSNSVGILPSRLFLRNSVHPSEQKDIYNYVIELPNPSSNSNSFMNYIHKIIYNNRKICLLLVLLVVSLFLIYRFVYSTS